LVRLSQISRWVLIDVSGIFTILVEGDDPNESIAECGVFPAINTLKSLSRSMHNAKWLSMMTWLKWFKWVLVAKEAHPEVDEAIDFFPQLVDFLQQDKGTYVTFKESLAQLQQITS
jgi:flagellum-specific ATP synthase